MANMGRFDGLKHTAAMERPSAASTSVPARERPGLKNAREGKKAVVGYFSPALSRALHLLALDLNTSIQGLLGEAIDDLLRKHGKHPFGEK